MLLKLICCDVFTRIACSLVATSPHIVDVSFIKMLAHNEPDKLRKDIQAQIDAATAQKRYDAVLLGYGLCGNASVGLYCPVPLIIPRVHDCCALFMGSKERYVEAFRDCLSTRWCSCGYYERGWGAARDMYDPQNAAYKTSVEYMGYVEQYGEENAEYLWETLHPDIETDDAVYIRIQGYEYSDSEARFAENIEGRGKQLRLLDGSLSYLKQLVHGPWDDKLFLTLQPGQSIGAVYDMDRVMCAK